MKTITTIGSGYSGSSAVYDYLKSLNLFFDPFPDTEPSQERIASITQLGEWQELTFDFSGVNTGTYKSMIIYFERNAPCDGDVYYFDDIIQE